MNLNHIDKDLYKKGESTQEEKTVKESTHLDLFLEAISDIEQSEIREEVIEKNLKKRKVDEIGTSNAGTNKKKKKGNVNISSTVKGGFKESWTDSETEVFKSILKANPNFVNKENGKGSKVKGNKDQDIALKIIEMLEEYNANPENEEVNIRKDEDGKYIIGAYVNKLRKYRKKEKLSEFIFEDTSSTTEDNTINIYQRFTRSSKSISNKSQKIDKKEKQISKVKIIEPPRERKEKTSKKFFKGYERSDSENSFSGNESEYESDYYAENDTECESNYFEENKDHENSLFVDEKKDIEGQDTYRIDNQEDINEPDYYPQSPVLEEDTNYPPVFDNNSTTSISNEVIIKEDLIRKKIKNLKDENTNLENKIDEVSQSILNAQTQFSSEKEIVEENAKIIEEYAQVILLLENKEEKYRNYLINCGNKIQNKLLKTTQQVNLENNEKKADNILNNSNELTFSLINSNSTQEQKINSNAQGNESEDLLDMFKNFMNNLAEKNQRLKLKLEESTQKNEALKKQISKINDFQQEQKKQIYEQSNKILDLEDVIKIYEDKIKEYMQV